MLTHFALYSAALLALAAVPLAAAPSPALLKQLQQFQQPTVILTGSWPTSIDSADLNNDAANDLIYTDAGATRATSITHVLVNNGDGTFSPGQTIATAGTSIAVADFDRDGHPDLEWVAILPSETLAHLYFAHGNGDGTFAPTIELGTFGPIGTQPPQLSLVAPLLRVSSNLDLFVEDSANSTLYELTANSTRAVAIPLPDGPGTIFTADLNADGRTDLILQTPTAIDVYLATPDGAIHTPDFRYNVPNGALSSILEDVDADSHPDLLIEDITGRITILHGFPDGTFATTSEGGTAPLDPTTGAGGHLIALTTSTLKSDRNLYTSTDAGISALQFEPNLSITLQSIFNAGPGHSSYAVADFNHDGIPDIALDSPQGISILFGNLGGTLQSALARVKPAPRSAGALPTQTVLTITTPLSLYYGQSVDGFAQAQAGDNSPLTGNITFYDGVVNLCTIPVSATINCPASTGSGFVAGVHSLTAAYSGDITHAASTSSVVNVTIVPDPVTATLTTSLTPAPPGQPVTFTATFTGNFAPPTGAVNFYDGPTNLGTVSLSSGSLSNSAIATLTISTLTTGTHPITVVYTATQNFNAAGAAVTQVINSTTTPPTNPAPTAVTLSSSTNPAAAGQTILFTAHVTNLAQPATTPTGSVNFLDGATPLGTAILSSAGIATLTISTLTSGTHTITAVYAATQNFSTSTAALIQVIITPAGPAAATTATTLTSSSNPTAAGQAIAFTAQVTNLSQPATIPTGSVNFLDGATPLGTAILSSAGIATLTISTLTGGTHTITAVYAATQNFSTSSASLNQVITPTVASPPIAANTATTLSSSTNPAAAGQTIIFTAHVANLSQPLIVVTGSVTFLDGTAALGTATLDASGNVTFTTSGLAPGSHSITASYAGNTAFSPSTSPTLTQIINSIPLTSAVTFTIAAGSGSATIATGDAATILVSVSPVNGFDQAVQLTCANLPEQAICTFATTTIAAGGGVTTLKLLTRSPRACGSSIPYNQPGAFNQAVNQPLAAPFSASASSLPYAAPIVTPILAGILILFLPKRRRTRFKGLISLVAVSLAMTGLLSISGCGACTNLGTRPGSYTLQITGKSTGPSPLTVNQSFRINVTP